MAANPVSVLLLLALLGALCRRAGATAFDVGGDQGWAVPPSKDAGMYNQWASKNRFLVGDTVHFKYDKEDSVMVVTVDDYDNCNATHPIFYSNNGDTSVPLDRPGLFYFISGIAGHCERGQRMVLKVTGQDSPPPPPTPAPPTPPAPSAAAAPILVAGAAVAVAAAVALPVIVLGV